MRRAPLLITITLAILIQSGCSNGPLGRMFRGGSCDPCQATPSSTYPAAYATSGCATCETSGSMMHGQMMGGGHYISPDVNAPFTGQPGYSGILPGPQN